MSVTMEYTEELVITSCWCGINLAIPKNFHSWLKDDSSRHCYCPQGHTFVYREGNKEKLARAEEALRAEQRRANAERDLRKAEEKSHAATRGHLTRVKKRVAHGVCPHCNRHFENLERHMHSKHGEEVKAS